MWGSIDERLFDGLQNLDHRLAQGFEQGVDVVEFLARDPAPQVVENARRRLHPHIGGDETRLEVVQDFGVDLAARQQLLDVGRQPRRPHVQLRAQALEEAADAGFVGFVRHRPQSLAEAIAALSFRSEAPPQGMMSAVSTKLDKPAPGSRNFVRIIGGGWRGRRVSFPDSPGLRPTPDRVRETLFNWLQHSIVDTRCLDLFAGSGALGLEALSRGAREVVFVEQAQAAARALQGELQRLGGTARARVWNSGRRDSCAVRRATVGGPFDLVFLDPPFGRGALAEYVPLLDGGDWLKPGGLVYLENERAAGVPELPPHWELLKSKSAGEVGYHLARVSTRSWGQ